MGRIPPALRPGLGPPGLEPQPLGGWNRNWTPVRGSRRIGGPPCAVWGCISRGFPAW